MRRLLIVAHSFPPCAAPGSARAWRLYKFLPEFGYETHVITSTRSDRIHPRVVWVPAPVKHFGERVLRKFFFPIDEDISWTLPALRAAERLLVETPMDAVLSTVPYIQAHIIAYRLKKRFCLRWIADYRDPIVGNPFRTTTGIPGMVDRFLDARFFANADLLLAVTDNVQHDWVQRCPEVTTKSAVIWNGYDPEECIAPQPIPARPYRVIAHFGNFYGGRSPHVLLASALRLIRGGLLPPTSIRFLLVGGLERQIYERHRELFEQLMSAGCLEVKKPMPRLLALDAMMESDSLLLADNNEEASGHTVPAKLFEYIRVRRPILALTEDRSPVKRILTMSGVPFVTFSAAMPESVIDARLLEFLSLSTEPCVLSERFLREFNGRSQARTLAGLLDRMFGKPGHNGDALVEEPSREMAEV